MDDSGAAHVAAVLDMPVVQHVLQAIADAVRKGDMHKATQLGHTSAQPLSLQPSDVGIALSPSTGQGATATLIAKGAQGQVLQSTWRGHDVAVKVPRLGTSSDLERFRREVALMAALGGHQHHIMPLLGARCLPPTYFLVMPLAGPSLAHLMYAATPGWRPTWAQVLHVGVQLAGALARMHEAGVVHRDLKPDNVLTAGPSTSTTAPQEGEGGQEAEGGAWLPHVVLGDLGLACTDHDLKVGADTVQWSQARGRMTRPTGGFHKQDMVGTQEYCAPELLLHSAQHSPASDVFALAVTLNELTTLTPPYSDCTRDGPPGLHTVLDTGYTRQQLAAAVAGEGLRPPPPLAASPPGWAPLLSAAWATDPAQRPSAAHLRDQLVLLRDSVLPTWAAQTPPDRGIPAEGDGEANGQPMDVDADVPALSTAQGAAGKPQEVCAMDGFDYDDGCDAVAGSSRAHAMEAVGGGGASAGVVGVVDVDSWERQLLRAGARRWDYAAGERPGPDAAGAAAPPAALLPCVTAGVVEAIGTRDTWEDRSVVMPSFTLHPPAGPGQQQQVTGGGAAGGAGMGLPEQGSLFAVFDGHRGAAAAELCARLLPGVLRQQLAVAAAGGQVQPRQRRQVLAAAVRDTLLALEQEFFTKWDGERRAAALQRGAAATITAAATAAPARPSFPGCTATVALLVGSTLTVGNLGDGKAVVGGAGAAAAAGAVAGGSGPLALTWPHTAACVRERERLAGAGGGGGAVWHEQGGGWRLPGCGLQVSRSIGDFDAKGLQPTPWTPPGTLNNNIPGQRLVLGTGLTAEPEVTQIELQSHHTWLVVGSDGLWDALSDAGVARLVADTVKHPAMTARRLVAEAMDAGSGDNITAVVAFLQPVTTLEQVFTATT